MGVGLMSGGIFAGALTLLMAAERAAEQSLHYPVAAVPGLPDAGGGGPEVLPWVAGASALALLAGAVIVGTQRRKPGK